MLARFSLYGFLKNQRYYEPFLVLLLLDRGVSFTALGLLIGLRKLTRAASEIPSGVIADQHGRRLMMVLSMASCLAAFPVFALGQRPLHFAPAMLLLGLSDALRTGTHKSMILQWLRNEGRADEKTRVYGYTRSWSKLGSASAAVAGVALVLIDGGYERAFWFAMIPYALNLLNLATYPAAVDVVKPRPADGGPSAGLWQAAVTVFRGLGSDRRQRRVMGESVGFAALHAPLEDYLQPMLLAAALAVPFAVGLDDVRRSAILVGAVYLALNLLSATASRSAHRVSARAGGDEQAARWIWGLAAALFVGLTAAAVGAPVALLPAAVALLVLHDLWRPVLVSRLDACSSSDLGATVFSVESQARSLVATGVAVAMGVVLDAVNQGAAEADWRFWPIGVLGLVITALALSRPMPRPTAGPESP